MTEARRPAGDAAPATVDTDWESDRKAWNLPQRPIARLPERITELGRDDLRLARETRDERISLLFRGWPSLNEVEMKEVRLLSDERQRLARHVGRLHARRAKTAIG